MSYTLTFYKAPNLKEGDIHMFKYQLDSSPVDEDSDYFISMQWKGELMHHLNKLGIEFVYHSDDWLHLVIGDFQVLIVDDRLNLTILSSEVLNNDELKIVVDFLFLHGFVGHDEQTDQLFTGSSYLDVQSALIKSWIERPYLDELRKNSKDERNRNLIAGWGVSIVLAIVGFMFNLNSEPEMPSIDSVMPQIMEQASAETKMLLIWSEKVTEVYAHVDISLDEGVKVVDDMIRSDTSLSLQQIGKLHSIIGGELYDSGRTVEALGRFELRLEIDSGTQELLNRGACHLRLKQNDEALKLFQAAKEMNYTNAWYLAMCYEILGQRKLAVEEYSELGRKEPSFAAKCQYRVDQLLDPNGALLEDITFSNRRVLTFTSTNQNFYFR